MGFGVITTDKLKLLIDQNSHNGSYRIMHLDEQEWILEDNEKHQISENIDLSSAEAPPTPKQEESKPLKKTIRHMSPFFYWKQHGFLLVTLLYFLFFSGSFNNYSGIESFLTYTKSVISQEDVVNFGYFLFVATGLSYLYKFYFFQYEVDHEERLLKMKRGIFFVTEKDIYIHNIRETQLQRNPLNMMTNTGTIQVSTAGSDGVEHLLRNVWSPTTIVEHLKSDDEHNND